MTRTYLREIAVQLTFMSDFAWNTAEELEEQLFASDYYKTLKKEFNLYEQLPSKTQRSYITSLVAGVVAHRDELNEYISRYSIGWKLERIMRVDLSILRLAAYEMFHRDDVPDNVAISEAMTMAGRYSEPKSSRYINGVLGAIERNKQEG